MADRMQRASELVEGLAFHPVAGRLARLLLDHFETAGDASILRYLTLDEMAARIGSTREMVCRALYSFSDKKLIEVTRTEFVLTDHEGLALKIKTRKSTTFWVKSTFSASKIAKYGIRRIVIMVTAGAEFATDKVHPRHDAYAPPMDGTARHSRASPRVHLSPRYKGSAITSSTMPAINDIVLQKGKKKLTSQTVRVNKGA